MKKTYLKYWIQITLLITLLLSVGIKADTNKSNAYTIDTNSVVAVMSFVNHSGNSKAIPAVMELLYAQLDLYNVNYLSHTIIRPTLRKHRIRTVGSINKDDVSHIKESIDIERIILGSINIYKNRENPEISISIRIIDANKLTIIAAVSQSATGKDFEKLFGLGKIESIDLLLQQTIQELIKKLIKDIHAYDNKAEQKLQPYTIALIPLDNISENKKAGLITENILLTTLVQNRYNVIEPGIISNVMQKNRNILRGEIDLHTLNQIRNEYHIDLLVTGSIDKFELPRGSKDAEIEIGLRTLDASNGKIISMFNDCRKGNDSESVFGFGKINAMGNLINESFNKYIHTLEKKSEKYFAKQN